MRGKEEEIRWGWAECCVPVRGAEILTLCPPNSPPCSKEGRAMVRGAALPIFAKASSIPGMGQEKEREKDCGFF